MYAERTTMTIKIPVVIMRILNSKKILVALFGVLLLIIRQHTDWLNDWQVEDILKPIASYLFAQGLEDWGKSEAMIRNGKVTVIDIWETIKTLFGQRKTGLMMTQLLIGLSNQLFPGLIDHETATQAINLLMASTVAIGVADLRKASTTIKKTGDVLVKPEQMEALG